MVDPSTQRFIESHKSPRQVEEGRLSTGQQARWVDSRITEKRRLAIAVPAINARMTTRSRALEFWPWAPPEKRVEEPADIVAG